MSAATVAIPAERIVAPLRGRVFIRKLVVRPSTIILANATYGEVVSPLGLKHANSAEDAAARAAGQTRADLGRVLAIHHDDARALGVTAGDMVLFQQESAAHPSWPAYARADLEWYQAFASVRITYRCREYERETGGSLEDFAGLCGLEAHAVSDVVSRRRWATAAEVEAVSKGLQAALEAAPGSVAVPAAWREIESDLRGMLVTGIVPGLMTEDDVAVPRPEEPSAWIIDLETPEERARYRAMGRMAPRGTDRLTDTWNLCALFGLRYRADGDFVTVVRAEAVLAEWLGKLPNDGELA